MNNKKHLAFFSAIAIFVIVLGTGVFMQENLRRNGQQVILATVPVDPRDFLRGDYVDLAYEIGRGEKATAFAKNLKESGPVYAVLTLGADNRVVSYSFTVEEPSEDTLFLRGQGIVEEYESIDKDWKAVTVKQGSIRYPQIEQYFVPEWKGWALDRIGRQSGRMEVKIALGKNGRAQILELLVDGKPVDFSTIEAENPYTEPLKPELEPAPAPPVQ